MNKGGQGNKNPRKIFNCNNCDEEFSVSYIGSDSKKIIKNCKECSVKIKTDNIITPRNLDELYIDFKDKILELFELYGTFTIKDITRELNVSPKTVTKMYKQFDTNLREICDKIGVPCNGKNKFQKIVKHYLQEIFIGKVILSEKTFKELINPKTGAKLRVDFFIEDLSLVVECDGKQHSDKNHYFTQLASSKGHITSIESDVIKETFFSDRGIKIIRVPYTQNKIDINYILNAIKLSMGNPEA